MRGTSLFKTMMKNLQVLLLVKTMSIIVNRIYNSTYLLELLKYNGQFHTSRTVQLFNSGTCQTDQEASDQVKYKMFVRAIENNSTFQHFIVITVKDMNSGIQKEICTKANFLKGAMHVELKMDYNTDVE